MNRHRGYFGLVRGGDPNNRAVMQGTSAPTNDLFQEGSAGKHK